MMSFYEAMQEVLQRPEYDILTGRAIDYQQILIDALINAIINFFEGFEGSYGNTPNYNLEVITYIFIAVAVLLLLIIIAGIAYVLLKSRGRNAAEELSVASIFDDVANKRFTLDDLLRLSREYADKKQFRDAVRHHYVAVLVDLHNKKTIQVNKSKTNAQLIRELTSVSSQLSAPFVAIVDAFHDTWFGMKALDEHQYLIFTANAEVILHEK